MSGTSVEDPIFKRLKRTKCQAFVAERIPHSVCRHSNPHPPMSQNTAESTDDVSARDLSTFQKEALFAIARLEASENDSYGLGIKRQLEERLSGDVNHGRLYPNLDDLVEQGILQKAQMDKRTNRYTLTDDGKELLRDYRDYVTETVASL